MMVRKWTEDATLDSQEWVGTATANLTIYDEEGNRNELKSGFKYIVSGDDTNYFILEGAGVPPVDEEDE